MRRQPLILLGILWGVGTMGFSATLGNPVPASASKKALATTKTEKKATGSSKKTAANPKKAEVPPPPPETAGNDNLGSMEVTGQAKDKVMIEKVTPEIKVEVKELVDSVTEKTEKLLEQARPIPSEEDFRRFDRVDSRQTARPWLPDLVEPPLISFQSAPAQTTVVSWRLEVTDDQGDVVHVISGKGNPVNEIVWDGFNREGKMIRVASAYAFRFITVDEFKEAHTTLGQAFTLRHLKWKDKKNLVIEISSRYLFQGDKISPEAEPILERALDVLREYSAYPFALEFQTDEPEGETVKARQKVVTEKTAADLLIPADSIPSTYAPVKDRGDVLRFVVRLR